MKKLNDIVSDKIKVIILVVIVFGSIFTYVIFNNHKTEDKDSVSVKVVATEADKARLEVLKKKFNYTYDEFEKQGWYENKSQTAENSYGRSLLMLHVNSTGYAYLEDQYYGNDWIFHTRVEVLVGDNKYVSGDVSINDKDNVEANGAGSVWEYISYKPGKDNGIIKAIAESGDNTVKVRFVGKQDVQDFTLAKVDQQALKDSYELSELLKKVSN